MSAVKTGGDVDKYGLCNAARGRGLAHGGTRGDIGKLRHNAQQLRAHSIDTVIEMGHSHGLHQRFFHAVEDEAHIGGAALK